ncbi:MAG: RpiB/LacA/LacB family sugar-phosphate isomerase [SAR202 cluster bacterium]|nr:RpiB/LacA/LacB family sugar-phosphate isomerase [SAR202 cluster bacterium]
MRLAVGSDEATHLTETVLRELRDRGHDVVPMGALAPGDDARWPAVGRRVGEAVASGRCDQGIVLCYTGTGVSIAANKVPGVRAALCGDAQTAAGARRWNDANVLAMSLRGTSGEVAREILEAWFATPPATGEDAEMVTMLEQRTQA